MESVQINTGIREGMKVVGSDGENLGTVDQIEGDYMIVRKGFFFPSDHYIPTAAASSVEGDQVVLGVTKETALHHGWDTQPSVSTSSSIDSEPVADSGSLNRDEEPFGHLQDTQRTHINAEDEIKVPLTTEELTATKREVERGSVDIHKDVVEEPQSIDVPVTEEQVEISRRAVDRDVEPGEVAFDEETLDVPLRGEEVDVEKRARVREEIDVSRDTVASTERVTDTVRREEVDIQEAGNVAAEEEGKR